MSTERSGIDPFNADIEGAREIIEKDWSLCLAYTPIFYTPWI